MRLLSSQAESRWIGRAREVAPVDQWQRARSAGWNGDGGHSELLAGTQFAAQFLSAELEVRNPLRGGLPDDIFALQAKQLRGLAAGELASAIQLQYDQLAASLTGRCSSSSTATKS